MRLRSERIVTPEGVIAGEVALEGEVIAAVARGERTPGALDVGERWIVPGFIDLHVHGGGGAQFNTEDPDEVLAAARFHASHGTTALLATTVAAPIPELGASLRAIAAAAAGKPSSAGRILGAHLEGPFISRRRPGAMDPDSFLDPNPAVLEELLGPAAEGTVRMVTLAPELPGALELVRMLAARGVIASLGHSDATYAQATAALDAGATSATHTFNAMRPLHHREPGILGAVLDRPKVSCELILDGIHLAPPAARLVHRAKGLAGIRLVTDAMQAAGMPEGSYRLGAAEVTVAAGRATITGASAIAGSTLTMDRAVANAVAFLGLSVAQAVGLASTNPARLLGIDGRKGALAPGRDADIAILDEDLGAWATIVAGEWVHGSPSGVDA